MWGSIMSRAKDLAANLEDQLNESVGLDAHLQNNRAAAATTSSGSSNDDNAMGNPPLETTMEEYTAPEVPPESSESIPVADVPLQEDVDIANEEEILNVHDSDPWQEDDDNLELDPSDDNMEPVAEVETQTTPAVKEPEEEPVEEESVEPPVVMAEQVPIVEAPPTAMEELTIDASTDFQEETEKALSADNVLADTQDLPTTSDGEQSPLEHPVVEPNESSAWNEDDLDVDLEKDVEEPPVETPVEMDDPLPAEQSPLVAPSVDETVEDQDESPEDEEVSPEEEAVTPEEDPIPVPPTLSTAPDPEEEEPVPLPAATPVAATTSALPRLTSPALSISATSMFSNFAKKAEEMAHRAEAYVDHAVHHNDDGTSPNQGGVVQANGDGDGNDDYDDDMAWQDDGDGDMGLDEWNTPSQEEEPASEVAETSVTEPQSTPIPEMVHLSKEVEPVEATQEVAQALPQETSTPLETVTSSQSMPIEEDPRYKQLLHQLALREEQLANKSMQMTELQALMETQERDLRKVIADTKEEAKRRIQRAKERCEAAEASNSDAAKQAAIIQELREEGEALARKQSTMEQAVRAAKGQSRELSQELEKEQKTKQQALDTVAKLEATLKTTKEQLSAASKGEALSVQLESNLLQARADAEQKASTILSLQQQIKELTAEGKELQEELARSRKEAAQEAKQEKKSLQKEHKDVISDLETRLRTTEREAAVREDALRHEVNELRKRWQDAIRRADALSMDVQSSTAPLLRQLESMERQNRVKAANWADLETRLRSELEETVIQNETLSKERAEFKAKYTRLERARTENDQELATTKRLNEEQASTIESLEKKLQELEQQAEKQQEEYSRVERLANEGVMRVRSEMTQTVVESEERYRHQIETLENELRVEREKRSQLEQQVDKLLDNAGMIVAPDAPQAMRRESRPKKLRQAQGQAEILAGALGFDSDSDGDSDDDDDDMLGHAMDRGEGEGAGGAGGSSQQSGGMNSYAALEQLTSKLKVAKLELDALRNNLRESEKSREALLDELAESRSAKEKLPLFESRVKELTEQNREMELEIRGLQDDIAEVRELYRTQLNLLLEEKATQAKPSTAEEPEAVEDTNDS
eukprot:Nitzschia sp. Nitz4//scaffold83_size84149//60792//64206//NITZ4_005182-RA/size84149-snap-gene-0.129-mRNA-1//1//CDS//3329558971//3930//frame0